MKSQQNFCLYHDWLLSLSLSQFYTFIIVCLSSAHSAWGGKGAWKNHLSHQTHQGFLLSEGRARVLFSDLTHAANFPPKEPDSSSLVWQSHGKVSASLGWRTLASPRLLYLFIFSPNLCVVHPLALVQSTSADSLVRETSLLGKVLQQVPRTETLWGLLMKSSALMEFFHAW